MYNNKAVHTVHMSLSVHNWDENDRLWGMNNKLSNNFYFEYFKDN